MRLPAPTPPTLPAASASASPVETAVRGALAAVFLFGSTVVTAPTPAFAVTDGAAIGKCLIAKCPLPLARCVTDPSCAANLLCIQTCTGREDEGDCQIECGDKFTDNVVADFTKCAVTDTQCVPQRGDDGSWPVPQPSAVVKDFKPDDFQGKWYISAGLNKAFDTFDCQLHKFEAPTPTTLVGNLQWRIKDPVAGSNFVTRYTVQEFKQDSQQPGVLYNHDNEFLHYQDDWYVLAQRKDEYALIYYRGSNDAWDGYGGATVYSREPELNPKYFGEIDEALQKVGRRFSEFTLTDNSCRAAETKLEEFEKDLVYVETRAAAGVQTAEGRVLREIEKDFKAVEREVEKDIKLVEKEVVKDVTIIEKDVEDEFNAVKSLFGKR